MDCLVSKCLTSLSPTVVNTICLSLGPFRFVSDRPNPGRQDVVRGFCFKSGDEGTGCPNVSKFGHTRFRTPHGAGWPRRPHAVQAIAVNVGLYKILYELLNRRPLFPTHEGLSLRRWDVPSISEERVERAARLYASNRAAAAALGIAPGSFGRLCRFYNIETPVVRKKREAKEIQRRTLVRIGDED